MNLDRTFCAGLRCGKADTCDRWVRHVLQWFERNPQHRGRTKDQISVTEYSNPNGKCQRYSPIEEADKAHLNRASDDERKVGSES